MDVLQNYNGGGRRYLQLQQGEITISAMKKMNMITFKHVAFYKGNNEMMYPTTDVMIKKMYWAEKRTKIGKRRKCIADLSRIDDGVKFVYEELDYMPVFRDDDRITRLLTKEKREDGSSIEIPVYTQELIRALKEDENTYLTRRILNRNIVIAGFRDRYAMYSLRFLLVNDYGLFSESIYEVQMYNAICEIMNINRFKERGVFL